MNPTVLAPAAGPRGDPEVGDAHRIAANLDVLGFELTGAELSAIDALEADGRTGPHPDTFQG
ncbi:hypothetical protein [Actinoplanes sp. DH11]|uniref:hypothetical protein n=1 Tax=Actinoplanes sp. DH11 TaxID=2857011 RepID=UPI001E3EF06A|nr:hypothetical protein [Actinoplanes sp. DH11]